MKINRIVLIFFIISVFACEKDKTDSEDIAENKWKLEYIKTDGIKESPDDTYVLEFINDSIFYMDLSVNHAGGKYNIPSKGILEITSYGAMTEVCCENDFDNKLIEKLPLSESYTVTQNELMINGNDLEMKFFIY